MLTKRNTLWRSFELFEDIIDDVEVNVVHKFAQRCEEVKQDLKDGWNDPILLARQAELLWNIHSNHHQDEDGYRPSELELQKRKEIRSLEYSLRSSGAERFLQRLNVATQSLSSEEFLKYCQERPELKELTVKKELTRMQYTLYTPDGTKLTDPEEIANYIESEPSELSKQHELLYRASNQTIFADIIVALTSFDGLIRPQLSAGTFVDDSTLVLDLSSAEPHVRGECFLNVSLPDGHNGQLSLAGALVEVCLCPSRNEFQAKVLYLSPCGEEPLTEQQVKDAAKSMAEIASI
eukprot:CAMPEP_0113615270 /NCGR_PEP_ID=MMETSP0017_2-20120614/7613_1 /TAXON_ID=2856 /ORGANISM="Cylindrotheca closterium" /LENGTH=292 /DNA_ID=CAMNT_0000524499 /DNA_START=110 /DNA_END=988 /DNA_ORIENTATION=- /assembly_acc=CAM_ASM_000147